MSCPGVGHMPANIIEAQTLLLIGFWIFYQGEEGCSDDLHPQWRRVISQWDVKKLLLGGRTDI